MAIAEELEAQVAELQKTLEERNEAYSKLEVVANESKEKRDNIKKLVKSGLGITEISEESLASLKLNADETIAKERDELAFKLEEQQGKVAEVTNRYETKIGTMVLKDTLRGLGIDATVQNDLAFEQLTNLVLAEAERDGVNFVFKKEDGTTKFGVGGKPLTIQERIAELQKSEYSFLFKPNTGAGTGKEQQREATPKGGTPLTKHISEQYR